MGQTEQRVGEENKRIVRESMCFLSITRVYLYLIPIGPKSDHPYNEASDD